MAANITCASNELDTVTPTALRKQRLLFGRTFRRQTTEMPTWRPDYILAGSSLETHNINRCGIRETRVHVDHAQINLYRE